MKMKFYLLLFLLGVLLVSCEKNTGTEGEQPEKDGNVIVKANISTDTKWTSNNVYQLAGRITVLSGATLTIEPGTVIKGEAGTGANATALLIARGARIQAVGTATAPIIFTTVADEITPELVKQGKFGSPNLEPDVNGMWGGVLILGKAPISASANEIQIEGIPTSDVNGLYGGTDENDNSGTLKYVSIRHGGANIGSGNEINGLTLGGVGKGTVIENVEVVANQDDGIEWFGGSVNVKNAVVWNVGDDAIDTDQAWTGTLDNFVVIAPSDHNFELDGPEGSRMGGHIIKNGTVIANDDAMKRTSADLINVDENSDVVLENIFITAIKTGQQINRVTAPKVIFKNITLNVSAEALPTHVKGPVPAGVKAGATGQGANTGAFGWTWAAKAGKLSNL